MIAHLENGRYSDANGRDSRILKETTAQQMHETLYTPDARLLGNAHGFFDFSDNGQRTLGHSGGSHPFYTLLLLLPDQNIGVFVAYDGPAGDDLTLQHLGFQRAFFDHYYPGPTVGTIQPPKDFAERAGRFVGSYVKTEGSYTTLEKYGSLMGTVEISDPGDGTLLLKTPWDTWRFAEAQPLYFRQVGGQFSLVFREDDHGRITHMFTDITPMFAFEKLNWYATPSFSMVLVLGCIPVFLSIVPILLVRAIRSRRLGGDRKPAPRGAGVAYGIIVAICALNLLFVVGTALWGNPFPLFGISVIYKIVLGLGVLSAMLTAGALVYMVPVWRYGYWSILTRVYYTVVTLCAVAFVWFLNYWNLLGWRF